MPENILQKALKGKTNFEAFALIDLDSAGFVFLAASAKAAPALLPALERFALHAVHHAESPEQLATLEQAVYYDIAQRQVVCSPILGEKQRCLLVAVVEPRKTYKRATQQLIKQLEAALS